VIEGFIDRVTGFSLKSCNHRIFMQLPINSVADLGLALRAVRRTSKLRLDDMAATAGVSKQFASDVELGKETVRMGLVFKAVG
jgi:DNA-binding XRE family transcriptional regulator